MRPLVARAARAALLAGAAALTLVSLPQAMGGTRLAVDASEQSVQAPVPLCRYGVDVLGSAAGYPLGDLGVGWLVNFTSSLSPAPPAGVTYYPTVRLEPAGAGSYALSDTTLVTITTVAAQKPGQTWIIGNEPDSLFQDSLVPEVYAQAYHDLYGAIKAADPTALIATAGIVQVTPVRLLYLDRVLESYRQQYGEPMPVDVWSIHVYILQEVSCQVYPSRCWGAEIPPGIDWAEGELYTVEDNANLALFTQMVLNFRAWMAARGYANRPLIVTEFGVQMPADYGFPPERVNAYMDGAQDFLRNAVGSNGYPADGHRLVQRWAWWSLQRPAEASNGWLYNPGAPPPRTVFGDNYAAYTARITPTVNLFPVAITTLPVSIYSPTDPVTLTLVATIANDGEVAVSTSFSAQLFAGTPGGSGVPLGPATVIQGVDGCGSTAIVSVTMTNLLPGSHPVYVVVDSGEVIPEGNEGDNILTGVVLVATERANLPLILRR